MSTTHEKSIVELLAEQRKTSAEFTKDNFGSQIGQEYPEMARELLASDEFIQHLATDFLLLMLRGNDVLKTLQPGPSSIRKCPEVYNQPLKYLYWGIQIRRLQEKQLSETLQKLAQEQERSK